MSEALAVQKATQNAVVGAVEQAVYRLCEMTEIPVTHHVGHAEGIYLREGRIPADRYVIGDKHLTRHYMVIIKGRMRMLDGDTVVEVGPGVIACEPGVHKLAYTLEEVWGINIMSTPLTDIASIEASLVEKSDLRREWDALVAANKPALLR